MAEPQPAQAPKAEPPAAPAPVMDVVPPPADQAAAVPAAPPAPHHSQARPAPKAAAKPPSAKTAAPAAPGVGGAIFATVIIVLGLAALAVYAYIKTR